jgi:hypothetical protein
MVVFIKGMDLQWGVIWSVLNTNIQLIYSQIQLILSILNLD